MGEEGWLKTNAPWELAGSLCWPLCRGTQEGEAETSPAIVVTEVDPSLRESVLTFIQYVALEVTEHLLAFAPSLARHGT